MLNLGWVKPFDDDDDDDERDEKYYKWRNNSAYQHLFEGYKVHIFDSKIMAPSNVCMPVHVCVCVCVQRESARERQGGGGKEKPEKADKDIRREVHRDLHRHRHTDTQIEMGRYRAIDREQGQGHTERDVRTQEHTARTVDERFYRHPL